MKRGQFEVIGLLVIVILISLGVLFVVRFGIGREASSLKASHVESQFAASFLNAYIETTSEDCHNQQMKALIHDCFSNQYSAYRVQCNNGGTPVDSCVYLNETAKKILNRTLIKDRRSFQFMIVWEGSGMPPPVSITRNWDRCARSTRIESKHVPLQVETKEIYLYLKLCN